MGTVKELKMDYDSYLAKQVEEQMQDCKRVIGQHKDEDGETVLEWSCDECDNTECEERN